MTIISALPNTISNGQPADAVPLMADLNHIVNQVNANAQEAGLAALLAAANTFTLVQSGVAATSAANFPIASQVQDFVFNTLTSTLGTNTVTARTTPLALSAYTGGQIFSFLPAQVNSGAVTLNINGVGAAPVMWMGTALRGGELSSTVPALVRYQSPNMHLLDAAPAPRAWTPEGTFATVGDLNIAYSSQQGRYVKNGPLVDLWGSLVTSTFTHATAIGNFNITGLPFPAASFGVPALNFRGPVQFGGVTKTNYSQVVAGVNPGTSVITLHASGSGQSPLTLMSSDMPTGGTLLLNFHVRYLTDR